MRFVFVFVMLAAELMAADKRMLFNGKNLDGWEKHGDGVWSVVPDGVLMGLHSTPDNKPFGAWPVTDRQYRTWKNQQAWLYTKDEFGEYDLHVEYWLPPGGNSGISIRDGSRGDKSYGIEDQITPAHIGYEIQIIDEPKSKYPTGSIYTFVAAPDGVQKAGEWNQLDIESRNAMIRVRLNGRVVAEHAGDPKRSKRGPIGLQLHDRFSLVLFRNITIAEIR